MPMIKRVAGKVKTFNKEEIKTAQKMCLKCGYLITSENHTCKENLSAESGKTDSANSRSVS